MEQIENANKLIDSQQTLLLSTVTKKEKPEVSYAPFVRDEQGVFYIFVSDLASHTQNMLDNSLASIMFIQPEHQAKNIFARERVIFECTVSEVSKNQPSFDNQLQAMREKLGEMIDLLQSLNDFHLLALTPVSAKYIAGFGQAFSLNVDKIV